MSRQECFQPADPDYETKVRGSFSRQPFMKFINARMTIVKPGYCEIKLPYKEDLTQQHGYFHAGIIATLADNAGGYAAYSLMKKDASILTVEFKLNLVSPGMGELLISRANVIKHGKSVTVCGSDVYAVKNGEEKLCGTSLITLMTMIGMKDKKLF